MFYRSYRSRVNTSSENLVIFVKSFKDEYRMVLSFHFKSFDSDVMSLFMEETPLSMRNFEQF